MKIDFLKDEYWWGGLITEAENMPYDCNTVFCTNLATDRVTQSAPLYLSSKGRYIWSEEPFTIEFNKGVISITSDFEVFLTVAGETLREAYIDAMEKILSDAERTGEPIIRSMEYMYPNCGYEKINDQFTVGEDILVAPVIKKGDTTKKVYIPTGRWIEQNTDDVYNGPCEVNVNAPLEILPWFKKTGVI